MNIHLYDNLHWRIFLQTRRQRAGDASGGFQKANAGSNQDNLSLRRTFLRIVLFISNGWMGQTNRLIQKKINPIIRNIICSSPVFQRYGRTTSWFKQPVIEPKVFGWSEVEKEVILAGQLGKIEIWAKDCMIRSMLAMTNLQAWQKKSWKSYRWNRLAMEYHQPYYCRKALKVKIKPDGYMSTQFWRRWSSGKILKLLNKGKLIGFDQDADALDNIPDDKRFIFVNHNFRFLRIS